MIKINKLTEKIEIKITIAGLIFSFSIARVKQLEPINLNINTADYASIIERAKELKAQLD